jgi:hypothetical protein
VTREFHVAVTYRSCSIRYTKLVANLLDQNRLRNVFPVRMRMVQRGIQTGARWIGVPIYAEAVALTALAALALCKARCMMKTRICPGERRTQSRKVQAV